MPFETFTLVQLGRYVWRHLLRKHRTISRNSLWFPETNEEVETQRALVNGEILFYFSSDSANVFVWADFLQKCIITLSVPFLFHFRMCHVFRTWPFRQRLGMRRKNMPKLLNEKCVCCVTRTQATAGHTHNAEHVFFCFVSLSCVHKLTPQRDAKNFTARF